MSKSYGWSLSLLATLLAYQGAQAVYLRIGSLWDQYLDEGNEGWGGVALVWPGGLWPDDENNVSTERSTTSYKGFLYGATGFIVPDTSNLGFTIPDADWPNGAGRPATGDTLPYYVVIRDIPNHMGGSWGTPINF